MHPKFFAFLTSREEVPPVRTLANGTLEVKVNKQQTTLFYRLTVNNIQKFTQAHFHLGKRGVNGPVVAFLFGLTVPGISVSHGVVTGTLTKKNLVGPLKGESITKLVELMDQEQIYVNAHTKQNPNGEIRGQVEPIVY